MNFDDVWDFIENRKDSYTIVQDKTELEHVFSLVKNSNARSYLEIGSAEGNTLYAIGSLVDAVTYVDFGEPHTENPRNNAIGKIGWNKVVGYHGDSTVNSTAYNNIKFLKYDIVMIDGGHDYTTVLSDSILYAPMAMKYVFWHDIQLPEVKKAVDWFVKRWKLGRYYEFINSQNYGYGIMEVGK